MDVFHRFGYTANIPAIYAKVIQEIITSLQAKGFTQIRLETPYSVETAIQERLNYVYRIRCTLGSVDEVLCDIPRVVDPGGYFIIEGIEKFPMIHEIVMKSTYILQNNTCTLRLLQCRKPVTVAFRDTQIMFVSDDYRIPVMNLLSSLGYDFSTIAETMVRMQFPHPLIATVRTILLMGSSILSEIIPTREDFFGSLPNVEIMHILVYMTALVIGRSIGIFQDSDLSDYANKTTRCYYDVVSDVFARALKQCKTQTSPTRRTFFTMRRIITYHIDKQVFQQFKTGVSEIFGRQYESVVMTVSRRSTIDAISSVRKIMIPTDENTRNTEMRMIHPSHRGYICPAETPEGRRVGLIRTLALSCIIADRVYDDIDPILRSWDQEHAPICCYFLNAIPRFVRCHSFLERLIALKLDRFEYLSISVHNGRYTLRTTRGRPMRMVRYHGRAILIDPSENWFDAIEEIHPVMMLGIAASMIPLSQHNQCARTVFGSSMIKQALELNDRPPMYIDHKRAIVAQRPIVSTLTTDHFDIANGINVVVAMSTYMGWNEEDAIVVKKSFVDRLGPCSVYTKIYEVSIRPDDVSIVISSSSDERYTHGIITVGSVLKEGDPFITYARRSLGNTYEIHSFTYDEKEEPCRVVDIIQYNNEQSKEMGIRFVTERLRTLRVGDKLSSRHAQKGVIGHIARDEDLPFSESSGMIPDILINPHAIPSRMTIGQLIESCFGKQCRRVDGTAFTPHETPVDDEEWMIHPMHGDLIPNPVSMGLVYYMILPHQSIDKIHHRRYGEVNVLSNQPLSGRSRGGGLRIGEMEIDCLISHGASELVRSVMCDSDMTKIFVCKSCGYLLSYDHECLLCHGDTVQVEAPYALKTIANVLQMAGIKMSFTE